MASSKHCEEEAEECHSSESGWTMYIGSPIHDDDNDDDGDDDDDGESNDDCADGDDGKDDEHSDDSMASDASSGPSLQGSLYGDGKDHFKVNHVKGYDFEKKTPAEKPFMEKQKVGVGMRKKEVKEERSLKTKRSSNVATSQSDTKVGKSVWLGRRK